MLFANRFKLAFLFVFGIMLSYGQTNPSHTFVKGFTRKDGTYVQGYYRTVRNHTNRDNFSTIGNFNQYTGKAGWIKPDSQMNLPSYKLTYPLEDSSIHYNLDDYHKIVGTTSSIGQKILQYSNGQEIFKICHGCEPINYADEKEYYWYLPNLGIQQSLGSSRGELLNGDYKFYDHEKNLLIQANYKNGLQNGDYLIWNKNGQVIEKIKYNFGEIDEAWFKNDDGSSVEWLGGIFSIGSIRNIYSSKGNLLQKFEIDNEFKFHHKIFYNNGGQLETEFVKGIGEFYYGEYKKYYRDGSLRFIGNFVDNIRAGIWGWYNESGKLIKIEEYKVYTESYSNGNIKLKGGLFYDPDRKEWIRDKQWVFYNIDGTVTTYKSYINGIEINP